MLNPKHNKKNPANDEKLLNLLQSSTNIVHLQKAPNLPATKCNTPVHNFGMFKATKNYLNCKKCTKLLLEETPLGYKSRRRNKIFSKTNNKCFYCGKRITPTCSKGHIDHMTPKNKGGNNKIQNLIPACQLCNVSKGNRTVEEYREWVKERTIKYLLKENIYHRFLPEELKDQIDKKLNEAIDILENSSTIKFHFETTAVKNV